MADDTLREMLEGFGNEGHVLSPLAEQDYEVVKNACESNMRIVDTFSPERFKGDVFLFVAANSHAEPPLNPGSPMSMGAFGFMRSIAPTIQ